ncbi:hypothetical protein [Pseudotabrizicola alkalilacus]|nr:hypothetical protein [Pseudotabrizicola alkalilacus]
MKVAVRNLKDILIFLAKASLLMVLRELVPDAYEHFKSVLFPD